METFFWLKLLFEFLGTGFLVGTIKFAVEESIHTQQSSNAPFAIALVLMIWVYLGGKISGAQYNPAVALGVYLRSKFSGANDFTFYEFLAYISAQFIGGICGGLYSNAAAGHEAGIIYIENSADFSEYQCFFVN